MSRRILRLAALAGVLLLAGCQSYRSVPYERGAEVKRVGLPTVWVDGEPTAMLASSVGQSFGLVGALIDAGMASSRASSLAAILASREFDAREEMAQALTAALEARGYEVVRLDATRGPDRAFLKSYPPAEPAVDAYLDVVLQAYGYAATGVGDDTPYRPYVYTAARLVAPGGRVLMEDHVVYNHIERGLLETQQVTVSPDHGYQYPTFGMLEAQPDKAVEGLEKAFEQTADTVGVLLQ